MQDDSKPLAFPFSGALLVAAVVGGALWLTKPYESLRPPGPTETFLDQGIGEAPVISRLWQDPFQVVEAYRKEAEKAGASAGAADPHSMAFLRNSLADAVCGTSPSGDGTRTILMPVLVPGSHWPVDAEARIRERHAVVSALGEQGFIPVWDRRISFLRTHWLLIENPYDAEESRTVLFVDEDATTQDKSLELAVPYEWFTDEDGSSVLVVWFDQTFFNEHAVRALDQVLTELTSRVPVFAEALANEEQDVPGEPRLALRLLGPPDSSSLRSLARELLAAAPSPREAASQPRSTPEDASPDARGPDTPRRVLTAAWPDEETILRHASELVELVGVRVDPLPQQRVPEARDRLVQLLSEPRASLPLPRVGTYLDSLLNRHADLVSALRETREEDSSHLDRVVREWRARIFFELAGDEPAPTEAWRDELLDQVLSRDPDLGPLISKITASQEGFPITLVDPGPSPREVGHLVGDLLLLCELYLDEGSSRVDPDLVGRATQELSALWEAPEVEDAPFGRARFLARLLAKHDEAHAILVRLLGSRVDSDVGWLDSVLRAWEAQVCFAAVNPDAPWVGYYPPRGPEELVRSTIAWIDAECRDRGLPQPRPEDHHELVALMAGRLPGAPTFVQRLPEGMVVLARAMTSPKAPDEGGELGDPAPEARSLAEEWARQMGRNAVQEGRRRRADSELFRLTEALDRALAAAAHDPSLSVKLVRRHLLSVLSEAETLGPWWESSRERLESELVVLLEPPGEEEKKSVSDLAERAVLGLEDRLFRWLTTNVPREHESLLTEACEGQVEYFRWDDKGLTPDALQPFLDGLWGSRAWKDLRNHGTAPPNTPRALQRTALERRLALEESLPLIPDGEALRPQLLLDLARWEADVANRAAPHRPMAEAFSLQHRLEWSVPPGLPVDLERDLMLALVSARIRLHLSRGRYDSLSEGELPLHQSLVESLLEGGARWTGLAEGIQSGPFDPPLRTSVAWAVHDWALAPHGASRALARSDSEQNRRKTPAIASEIAAVTAAFDPSTDEAGALPLFDVASKGSSSIRSVIPHLTVLNSHATAAKPLEAFLSREFPGAGPPTNGDAPEVSEILGAYLESRWGGEGPRFLSTASGDHLLLRALVLELLCRGFDPEPQPDPEAGNHRLLLVGEWDTVYGRGLPEAVEETVAALTGARDAVRTVRYIRGLDGPSRKTEEKSEERRTATPWEASTDPIEEPHGESQFDYVRRLAKTVLEEDRRERARGGRIFAVGVLGSDVYDKLLILQALREFLPDAIFFTTDLDARLFHGHQSQWARNLIVASSWGLSPDEDLPPFRDSYQTATFQACKLALRHLPADAAQAAPPEEPVDPRKGDTLAKDPAEASAEVAALTHPLPRLFEVGRSGAFELSRPPEPLASRRLARAASALFLVLLVALAFSRRLQCLVLRRQAEFERHEFRAFDAFVLAHVAAAVLFGVLLLLDRSSATPEPLTLFEGISVWPTVAGRLFASALGIGSWRLGVARLRASDLEIARTYHLAPPEERPRAGLRRVADAVRLAWAERATRGVLGALWAARERLAISAWRPGEERDGDRAVDGAALWREYLARGSRSSRWVRLAPLALGFLVLAWAHYALAWETTSPARGAVARWADTLSFALVSTILIATTFLVIDATRLFERFVRLLAERPTSWPERSTAPLAAERGLPADACRELLDVEVIARRSRVVGRWVLIPFTMLFLLVVTRNAYFDRWTWPASMLLTVGLLVASALVPAYLVRRAAESARSHAVARLRKRMSTASGEERETLVERLRLAIEDIRGDRRGAFSPYLRSPVLQAAALPFGGFGVLALLEFLTVLGI